MGQIHHASATTTAAVRRAIQYSQESLRTLAKRQVINCGEAEEALQVGAAPHWRSG